MERWTQHIEFGMFVMSKSEIVDTAGFASKKMIVNCLIGRVEVTRGDKLHIDFKIGLIS